MTTAEEFLRSQIRAIDTVLAGVEPLQDTLREARYSQLDFLDQARERRAREAGK